MVEWNRHDPQTRNEMNTMSEEPDMPHANNEHVDEPLGEMSWDTPGDTLYELGAARGRDTFEKLTRASSAMRGFADGMRDAQATGELRTGEEHFLTSVREAWEAAHAEVPLRAMIANAQDLDDEALHRESGW